MPLFHSNSLMVGLAPALVVRRVGRPRTQVQRLAVPGRRPPLRGDLVQLHRKAARLPARDPREARRRRQHPPHRIRQRGLAAGRRDRSPRRFGLEVVDVFGSTEGAIALDRSGGPPRGSIGALKEDVAIVDPDGNPVPVAEFDSDGRLTNADVCVGEIVNTSGVGSVRGLLQQRRSDEGDDPQWLVLERRSRLHRRRRLGLLRRADRRTGCGWTARTSPPARSMWSINRHPDVFLGAVYGVPDVFAGDQVMVALVLQRRRRVRPRRLRTVARRAARPLAQVAPEVRPDRRALSRRHPPTRCSPGCSSTRSTARTAPAVTLSTCEMRGDEVVSPDDRRRRGGAAQVVRQRGPAQGLGPLEPDPEPSSVDLSLGESEARLADEVREWLSQNIETPPEFARSRRVGRLGRIWQARLADAGWVGIDWPAEYGGRGASPVEVAVFNSEYARSGAPQLINRVGINLAGPTLLAHGSKEQLRAVAAPDHHARRRSGASSSASRAQVRISQVSRPGRSRLTTVGSSPGRRSGRPTRSSPSGGCVWRGATRSPRAHGDSRCWRSTWDHQG